MGKRWLSMVLILVCLLLTSVLAYAKEATGDGFAIAIPDGGNIYYYTSSDTNMAGDMLKGAQEENPLMLTGVYTPKDGAADLAYSLKLSLAPEGGIKSAAEAMGADYSFGEATDETVGGYGARVMNAVSGKNPDYAVRLYEIEKEGNSYLVTLIYKTAGDDQYLKGAMAQLNTLKLGADAIVVAAPTPTPTPISTPAPSPTAAIQTQETALSVQPLMPVVSKQEKTETFAGWVVPTLLMVGAAAAVITIVLLLRKRNNVRRTRPTVHVWQEEGQGYAAGYGYQKIAPQIQPQMDKKSFAEGFTAGYTAGYRSVTPPRIEDRGEDMLSRAYRVKDRGDYILAAQAFHEYAKETNDAQQRSSADVETVECLMLAKQEEAAYKLAKKLLLSGRKFTATQTQMLIDAVEGR